MWTEQREATMRDDGAALDLWLRRGLSERYGAAVTEPLTEDMLRLLDEAF